MPGTEGRQFRKLFIKLILLALAVAIAFTLFTYGCAKSEQNDQQPAGRTGASLASSSVSVG
jgi:hypothetical protein